MKELQDLTTEELIKKEKQLRKELFNLRFQLASGRVESPAQIRKGTLRRSRPFTTSNAESHRHRSRPFVRVH